MTLSDDEEPTSTTEKANEAVNLLVPEISLEVQDVNAVPTALAAPSTPTESLPCTQNPLLGSMLSDCPSADVPVPQQGPVDQINNPNLLGILGNYTPSELARVTTHSLIECIAKFPALWDSHEPSHWNNKYCSLLWKNIALVLQMQVKRAKSKWYSLRSAYRKEFFKSKATGIPSRFAYFQALSFLETETLREKERGDLEKSKVTDFFTKRNSTPAGSNGLSIDLNDDDCMIVDNLEDWSEGSTTATAFESPSIIGTMKASEINNKPDGTRLESNTTPLPVNGTASVDEQARPVFLIRPKKISDLMPVPTPTSLKPTSTSDSLARSPSPEIVFISEKPHSTPEVPKIVVSDTFPVQCNNPKRLDPSSSYALQKTNLEDEMRSSVQKVVNTNSHRPPKKSKIKSKLPKMSHGASKADAAVRFLKEPHGLPEIGNETSGPSKNLNGKRVSEIMPSTSKPTKKPKLPSSESTKESDRPRDVQELSEVNKGFLVSLLPDVEGMTNAQFRTFKKQATSLVSMILDR